MIKQENQETGEITVTLTGEEVKKYKLYATGLAALMVLSIGGAAWSVLSMTSLRSENELYRNQLKMADEKMKDLESKTQTVEKISEQLQNLMNTPSQDSQNGIGGASTVPDIARTENTERRRFKSIGELLKQIRSLDERLDKQIKLLVDLRSEFMNRSYGVSGLTFEENGPEPVAWPVRGSISSYYGYRGSPGGYGSSYHEGVDIAGDYGMPISATAPGIVSYAGWVDGYGYLVEVKHANGFVTRYGHNSAILVKEGQNVDRGTVVALMGSTGNSTGPHCHYEVRINGNSVDPLYSLQGQY